MRIFMIVLALIVLLAIPVSASQVGEATVPKEYSSYMPEQTDQLGAGIWEILGKALVQLRPELKTAGRLCFAVLAAVMVLSLLRGIHGKAAMAADLAGVVCICGLLLQNTGSMIRLGADTVTQVCQYGQLLLPVMTSALAAQGGTASSAALYTVTALFNNLLSASLTSILMPMIYIFLALSIIHRVTSDSAFAAGQKWIHSAITWILRLILYIFTGYISITGVVSGATDQAALKATRITIANAVPVIGGILSDASESILVSAAVVKNAAGIYGMLAVMAIAIEPFLKIGVQYLLLKLTSVLCGLVGDGREAGIVEPFCSAMGFLLAMTGTACVIQIISTVCFMKGMQL